MSRRPPDWHPLAGADPVPGDPHEVHRTARRYRDTAKLLRKQAKRLRELAADDQQAKSWEKFQAKAPEVADRLEMAQTRYEEAASALSEYAGQLDEAQAEADQALLQAKDADRRREQAQGALLSASAAFAAGQAEHVARSLVPGGPPSSPPEDGPVRRAAADLDAARDDLRRARRRLERAVGERDSAADRARSTIKTVNDADGLKDSAWDKVRGAASDGWTAARREVGKGGDRLASGWDSFKAGAASGWTSFKDAIGKADWISTWADRLSSVATWLGTAALVVGMIPGLQGVAAVLGAVALACTLVALAGHLVRATAGHDGWSKVALGVVSVATLGLGRVFAGGAKASFAAARAGARMSAAARIRAARPGVSTSTVSRYVNSTTGGKAGVATARPSTVARAGTGRLPTRQHWDEGRQVTRGQWPDIKGGFTGKSNDVMEMRNARRVDVVLQDAVYKNHMNIGYSRYAVSTGFTAVGGGIGHVDSVPVNKLDGVHERTRWAP